METVQSGLTPVQYWEGKEDSMLSIMGFCGATCDYVWLLLSVCIYIFFYNKIAKGTGRWQKIWRWERGWNNVNLQKLTAQKTTLCKHCCIMSSLNGEIRVKRLLGLKRTRTSHLPQGVYVTKWSQKWGKRGNLENWLIPTAMCMSGCDFLTRYCLSTFIRAQNPQRFFLKGTLIKEHQEMQVHLQSPVCVPFINPDGQTIPGKK